MPDHRLTTIKCLELDERFVCDGRSASGPDFCCVSRDHCNVAYSMNMLSNKLTRGHHSFMIVNMIVSTEPHKVSRTPSTGESPPTSIDPFLLIVTLTHVHKSSKTHSDEGRHTTTPDWRFLRSSRGKKGQQHLAVNPAQLNLGQTCLRLLASIFRDTHSD